MFNHWKFMNTVTYGETELFFIKSSDKTKKIIRTCGTLEYNI